MKRVLTVKYGMDLLEIEAAIYEACGACLATTEHTQVTIETVEQQQEEDEHVEEIGPRTPLQVGGIKGRDRVMNKYKITACEGSCNNTIWTDREIVVEAETAEDALTIARVSHRAGRITRIEAVELEGAVDKLNPHVGPRDALVAHPVTPKLNIHIVSEYTDGGSIDRIVENINRMTQEDIEIVVDEI